MGEDLVARGIEKMENLALLSMLVVSLPDALFLTFPALHPLDSRTNRQP